RLRATLALRPPAGTLDLDALLSAPEAAPGQPPPGFAALAWQATVKARGIDPDEAVAGTPHGDLRIDASGAGKGGQGAVDLKGLVASVAGAHLDARGRFDTGGAIRAVANLDSSDLGQLRAIGV